MYSALVWEIMCEQETHKNYSRAVFIPYIIVKCIAATNQGQLLLKVWRLSK